MNTSSVPFTTLLVGLTDPNSEVRQQTISAIMCRRKERGQAVANLLPLLTDPESQVCKAAIKALGTLGDPRAIPVLQALLTHQNVRFRLLVLRALVRVDYQQPLPHLLTALHDQSVSIRRYAVRVLRTLRDTHAVDPLIAALGSLGDTRAREPLRALLADPISDVAQQARAALAQLEGSV